jgi:hypothetical protein
MLRASADFSTLQPSNSPDQSRIPRSTERLTGLACAGLLPDLVPDGGSLGEALDWANSSSGLRACPATSGFRQVRNRCFLPIRAELPHPATPHGISSFVTYTQEPR